MIFLVWLSSAFGGTGPWVPGTGNLNLYVGVEGQSFHRLKASGDGASESLDVGDGVSTFVAQAAMSYGISSRAEVSLSLPFQHSNVGREDAGVCTELGLDACKTTDTVGIIEARVKGLILDELSGAPVSLSLASAIRYGGLSAQYRARLTGAGEGTLDFGPAISIGRSGPMGQGYFVTSLDIEWLYRIPNTRSYPQLQGEEAVPGSEFLALWDLFLTPKSAVSFGPSVTGSWRPEGRDFLDLELEDIDRFSALRYAQVRVGGKLILRDKSNNSFSLAVYRTAVAWNSPSDTLTIGAGVSLVNLLSRKN